MTKKKQPGSKKNKSNVSVRIASVDKESNVQTSRISNDLPNIQPPKRLYTFLSAQTQFIERTLKSFANGTRGQVAVLGTGVGKTATAAIIISNFLVAKREVLLVVPKKLTGTWENELKKNDGDTSLVRIISHEELRHLLHGNHKGVEFENLHAKILKSLVIVDEAHLLIDDYFQGADELMKHDKQMPFTKLHFSQKYLLTLSNKSLMTVLLTATPIVRSVLDFRWLHHIAKGYDGPRTEEDKHKSDEHSSLPLNAHNFCAKFTKVNGWNAFLKFFTDFMNKEGTQAILGRIVTYGVTRGPYSQLQSAADAITFLTTMLSFMKSPALQQAQRSLARTNETYNAYLKISVLISSLLQAYQSNSGTSSNGIGPITFEQLLKNPTVVVMILTIVTSIGCSYATNYLNKSKIPGERDMFLTRTLLYDVFKDALAETFYFGSMSAEEKESSDFPKENRKFNKVLDFTAQQRILSYRYQVNALNEADKKRLGVKKEHSHNYSSDENRDVYGLKIGNIPNMNDLYPEKFIEIGKVMNTVTKGAGEYVYNRFAFYTRYDDTRLLFNKYLFALMEERLQHQKQGGAVNFGDYAKSFVQVTSKPISQSPLKQHKQSKGIQYMSSEFSDNFCFYDDIEDSTEDIATLLSRHALPDPDLRIHNEVLVTFTKSQAMTPSVVWDIFIRDTNIFETISKPDDDVITNFVFGSEDTKEPILFLRNNQEYYLTIGHLKKWITNSSFVSVIKSTFESEITEKQLHKHIFDAVQRWSLYVINKRHHIYVLGDVLKPERILNEFNNEDLEYQGSLLLHAKWMEGINVRRVQQFHILDVIPVYSNKQQVFGRVARNLTHPRVFKDKVVTDPYKLSVDTYVWICNDNMFESFVNGRIISGSTKEAELTYESTKSSLLGITNVFSNVANALKAFDLGKAAISTIEGVEKGGKYLMGKEFAKASKVPASLEMLVNNSSEGLIELFEGLESRLTKLSFQEYDSSCSMVESHKEFTRPFGFKENVAPGELCTLRDNASKGRSRMQGAGRKKRSKRRSKFPPRSV